MTTLYSAKSTINAEGTLAYRITKFVDGEVESSYLTTPATCDCPAGVRPTCRHRQMLPQMIHDDIINTHWFLEWDNKGGVVDFEGNPADPLLRHPDLPAGEALQGSLPLEGELITVPSADGWGAKDVTPTTPEPAPQTQPAWRQL